ncbi:WAP four-disulfide core domain protein 8-like isoform X2 [Coturnix japonica]|uniref:WAP four-disulfide core domain protein 8-like isoform X2 n=1 Tax=Coturnix japonica TaxID=93934 RepID=UPI0013A5DBCD|nr:WAP four-disulfide core domain protein 8-like isoform X2 [Coturnix japonica]XP_032304534.1 WAP four-disulfide core domain protein 8-like isoform X2 [Coturnix japonica]XP_032304535.1 WAP four-disulfide core domain protein 8-like isoform X2 [Coturnix japonica]
MQHPRSTVCLGLCLLLGLLLSTEPSTALGEEDAHPGVCPQPSSQPQRTPCPSACGDDRGCPQDLKCCFTTCGFICVTPLGNGSSDFPPPGEVDWSLSQAESTHQGELQKPGLCPRDFTRCLQQEPPLCTNDSTCPGWLKCCSHKCRLRCTPPAEDICHLPAVPGPCGGHELSFFYNVTSGQCETFPYSGCGGNANRFGTWAACRRVCLGHEKPKTGECPTMLLELEGPCQQECNGDGDCPDELKCCNSSCGLQCLPAAPARESSGTGWDVDHRQGCGLGTRGAHSAHHRQRKAGMGAVHTATRTWWGQ